MKKQLIFTGLFFLLLTSCYGQQGEAGNTVKIFVSRGSVNLLNVPEKQQEILQDRLYRKLTQIINQSSIAEIGYSSFLAVADFDVVTVSSSQTGMASVYLADCELTLRVKRTSWNQIGEATFHSMSRNLTGSGSSKDEAIASAINNLQPKDKELVAFFLDARKKIDAYYAANCNEVLVQAEQFLKLKNYEASIALYFSIPTGAPCYSEAWDASQKVYATYIEDVCNKNLVKLKAYVALAQTENYSKKNYYDSAMHIMSNLSPASDKCYIESMKEIEKIEARLNGQQKSQWELLKQVVSDEAQVNKEKYKAMGRISKNYQPPQNPAPAQTPRQ
jgi:hypothetical protein